MEKMHEIIKTKDRWKGNERTQDYVWRIEDMKMKGTNGMQGMDRLSRSRYMKGWDYAG